MSVEVLLMAVLIALTAIAYMVAINARGLWRLTLSFLFATCMLGGTVWVIVQHYSSVSRFAMEKERRKFEREKNAAEERLQIKEQDLDKMERAGSVSRMQTLIAQANGYASLLTREKLYDQNLSHSQLIARAAEAEQQVVRLQREIDGSAQVLDQFPEASRLLSAAMGNLTEACRFYRKYYYSENSAAERTTERLLRQNAHDAQGALQKASQSLQ
ncbi:MAG: hypothetical protein LBI42_00740 [Chitinispirillales bacterium]|nr:hypothetical protein [Chitinispirillales bacterium]